METMAGVEGQDLEEMEVRAADAETAGAVATDIMCKAAKEAATGLMVAMANMEEGTTAEEEEATVAVEDRQMRGLRW